MKDRIIYYLAAGLKHGKIAEIVNCTPAYVSQIADDPDSQEEIAKAKKELDKSKVEEKIEEDYMKLEERTLVQINENLPFAEFQDLTRLMDSLIKRKQSRTPFGLLSNNGNTHNNITVLNVPVSVLPGEIVLNKQNEMIAVGDKTLAPMTTLGVKKLFETLNKKKLPHFPDVDVTKITSMPEDF